MNKIYNPLEIELSHYNFWEESGFFASGNGDDSFSIVIPPPNVTGTLHIGHAFEDTIMDTLIRYQRMLGKNVLWQPGMDHAGIATQMVVERLLNEEGITKHELGRDKFIERVWDWKDRSGNIIGKQLRRLGCSLDWSKEKFTMDKDLSLAVNEVFVRLFEEKLIYRGKRLVNWDPDLKTALSDLEVISNDEETSLWYLRYPIHGKNKYLVVATTRPETMFGDVAVAVNPDDERYKDFIGCSIKLPLVGRLIPIIADEYVDKDFASGCVKITPGHDFNDYAIGKKHNLSIINIYDKNIKLNQNVPKKYRNLDRAKARDIVISDLTNIDLLDKEERYVTKIPRGDRSGQIVEPFMTNQWFVKIKPLAVPAIEAVESGDIRFHPNNWEKTYFEWMKNIEDWCISRQLWWGHRIPAWYDDNGNIYVARDEDEARLKNGLSKDTILKQDEDVLDTWFSSALWPFSTLGWPNKNKNLQLFYPTTLLVTGFDIIFFWVARMIMMGLKFMDSIPFKDIYIHGLIRDHEGNKMSKSKGNVLDPIDIIEGVDLNGLIKKRTEGLMQPKMKEKIKQQTIKEFPEGINAYGADALRMTLASLATTGRNVSLDLKRVEGYRNFCNKIWNASHYVLRHDPLDYSQDAEYSIADKWMLSRFNRVVNSYHENLRKYRIDLAAKLIYEFVWHEFCDWYIEFTKIVFSDQKLNKDYNEGSSKTLYEVLEGILKLVHPIMPFITEEIWIEIVNKRGVKSDSIMLESIPEYDKRKIDKESEVIIEWIKSFVIVIRNIRGEMNIAPRKLLSIQLLGCTNEDKSIIEHNIIVIKSLGRLANIEILNNDHELIDNAFTGIFGSIKISIPMDGLIDIKEEKLRIERKIKKLGEEISKREIKLRNESFLKNAPVEVVKKEKDIAKNLKSDLDKLNYQLNKIS
ncbi:MAG: valine--tRNA ligase [Gammaproteobacteria bacterium TMED78]|nr:MAG: valine--tRNA ligase [Gammaproteobacteria bacterium TMED78]|tara:strand:- start:44437 stop:47187 length:2751 start_codon:yes stop_codon:yes gene_type:complete